jgi:ABC-type antimicrobial peptide transport system permease subunit
MEERKLEVMGRNVYPMIKEVSFSLGITLGSVIAGYLLVSGRWKSCIDIYQVVESKVKYAVK